MKNRSMAFDAARALAALYIVGFHHVLDYSPLLKRHVDPDLCTAAKQGCLAFFFFFFCSAYLVSRRTEIGNASDALRFWKRRCVRLLPLYLVALFSFSRPVWLTLLSAIGLNNFVPGIDGRNISTLWFVSQLMLWYALYPFLRAVRRKSVLFATCLAIELVLWRGSGLWGWDHRLWWYFPLYAAGIFVADVPERRLSLASIPLGSAFAVLAVFGLLDAMPIATAVCGCGLVFGAATVLSRAKWTLPFFGAVSYASMCAYFFHRKIFFRLIGGLVYWTGPKIQGQPVFLLWMYLLFLPAVFASGWLVQRGYDTLVRRFARPKRE